MDENPKQRGGCRSLIITAAILALPLLYFLSSGPAYLLADAGYLSADTYRAIYSPLIQLCHVSPSFNEAWKHYLILCGA
ncbi:MAG: hypothetical protein L0211_14160 [Planctomycetaceae bacterium]|nr:hypothetical protein [Planctomycetaceae bacterium]